MKKIMSIIFIGICLMCTSCGEKIDIKTDGDEVLAYEDICENIIRFHVIANSDSKEDQALKLKVRDRVIEYMVPKVENCSSLDEAREILNENIENVNQVALEVIKENSYDYSVNTMISRENFPDKLYGEVVFPAGEYEAFRIVIGSGQGQNWWCVMFPPLCFVDESKDNINSQEIISKVENTEEVVFKSKIWDKLKELF